MLFDSAAAENCAVQYILYYIYTIVDFDIIICQQLSLTKILKCCTPYGVLRMLASNVRIDAKALSFRKFMCHCAYPHGSPGYEELEKVALIFSYVFYAAMSR